VQRLFDFLKKPVQLSEKDIAAQVGPMGCSMAVSILFQV